MAGIGFYVTVNAGSDAAHSSVSASGSVTHVITDDDRNKFGLSDAALKNAVAAYFGQAPDDAYLCSPTPWNDLYTTYGWPQVQTVVVAQGATIVGVSSQPTILATKILTNNSSVTGTFSASITQSVSNTTQESWSTTDTVAVAQQVNYGIKLGDATLGGQTTMTYTHAWTKGGSESQTTTLGDTAGVSVSLQPGQSVVAELQASQGTMTLAVTYQAYLTGDTAINYGGTYKGHHFWALDIGAVMAAGSLASSKTYTENLTINYFANGQVVLKNPSTGEVLASSPATFSIRPERAVLTPSADVKAEPAIAHRPAAARANGKGAGDDQRELVHAGGSPQRVNDAP